MKNILIFVQIYDILIILSCYEQHNYPTNRNMAQWHHPAVLAIQVKAFRTTKTAAWQYLSFSRDLHQERVRRVLPVSGEAATKEPEGLTDRPRWRRVESVRAPERSWA